MIGYGHGQWLDRSDDQRRLISSEMWLHPVFHGTVNRAVRDGWSGWRANLNGEDMGGYPTMAGAKSRIDWEVWNRLRQIREGYKLLLSRREHWKDAGNAHRAPEYLGVPGEKSAYPSIDAADAGTPG